LYDELTDYILYYLQFSSPRYVPQLRCVSELSLIKQLIQISMEKQKNGECPDLLNMLKRASIKDPAVQETRHQQPRNLPDVVVQLAKEDLLMTHLDENLNVVNNMDDDEELQMIHDSSGSAFCNQSLDVITGVKCRSPAIFSSTCQEQTRQSIRSRPVIHKGVMTTREVTPPRCGNNKRDVTTVSETCPLSLWRRDAAHLCRNANVSSADLASGFSHSNTDAAHSAVAAFPAMCDEEICTLLATCCRTAECSCGSATMAVAQFGSPCHSSCATNTAGDSSGPRPCKRIKLHNRPFLDFEKMQRQKASFRRSSAFTKTKAKVSYLKLFTLGSQQEGISRVIVASYVGEPRLPNLHVYDSRDQWAVSSVDSSPLIRIVSSRHMI
jgi:hypothetical protein